MVHTALSRRTVLKLSGAAAAGSVLLGAQPARASGLQRAYLGTYTSAGGAGIGLGSVDPGTGALTVESWHSEVADPSWLAISGDGRTVFAVSERVPDGQVSALTRGAELLSSHATGWGPAHVAVHPSGKYVFTSLYSAGAVVSHAVLADGQVGAALDVHQLGAVGSHAHQAVLDRSGRWLFALDLGGDAVHVLAVQEDGRLRAHQQLRLPAGSGPRHLAFHPDGRRVYVLNEGNSTIVACAWRNAVLTAGQVRSTSKRAMNHPAEVLVAPNGRHVYVTNRGENSVAVFAVAGAGLRPVGAVPCGGEWPRHAAIDKTGNWLYVANQQSDEVTWFALDPATGMPSGPVGRASVPAIAQVLLV